ncbi:MaoC/PaaZ C-terminal domain-containing protein [Bradyrhizobium elkanii]|nr:MaoC/PaaZ C-terminal domain-containing protein [Bradyrhizobium elkanii]
MEAGDAVCGRSYRGQTFKLGSYTIGEAEILEFAGKYDPVPIHTDPVAAAVGPFGA